MRAKIKFNSSNQDQARTLLAALRQSFTPSMLNVVLEEIAYVPNPVRNMDLVFQDVNTKLPANQVEIVLLDWTPCPGEPSMLKIQGGGMLCNLKARHRHSLTPEKVMEEFTRHIFSLKAKEFAKASSHTLEYLDELRGFYLASQKAVSTLPSVLAKSADAFQSKIIIDRSKEVWVQVTEFKRIKLPLSDGWGKALFFFLLKNEEGFVFKKFPSQSIQDIKLLAELYVSTRTNAFENEIINLINYQTREGRTSKFFSPYFSKLGKKLASAAGHLECYDNLKLISKGKREEEKEFSINIDWDRSAIIWE